MPLFYLHINKAEINALQYFFLSIDPPGFKESPVQ